MYRLHAGNHVVSVEKNVCRLQDHDRSLELTALTGQLAVLVHRLVTGFTRRSLFEVLCDEVHPTWSRPHMWEQLGAWLIYEKRQAEPLPSTAIPENALAGSLSHLRAESAQTLHARANQVIHLNTILEPAQSLVLSLARDGWRAFVSHDPAKIAQTDTSLYFSSAHIGAGRTELLAQQVRKLSPWASVVSSDALRGVQLGPNHQALWLATSAHQLLDIGPHLAVDLPTLPILLTDSCVAIGPWLKDDHECLECVAATLGTLAGQPVATPPLSSSTLALVTVATHIFLDSYAQQWMKDPANHGGTNDSLPPAGDLVQTGTGSRDRVGSNTVIVVPAKATNFSTVQLPDLLRNCPH
ncbi:hypothetical protein [Micrococcoides hystricis]|uniref:Uncharacterized protein n=1 Tax=Micrococcoides hystricis TaxID=1572761 RepID=A0ABV6P8H3_9MICC